MFKHQLLNYFKQVEDILYDKEGLRLRRSRAAAYSLYLRQHMALLKMVDEAEEEDRLRILEEMHKSELVNPRGDGYPLRMSQD